MPRVAHYLPPLIKSRMEELGLDIQSLARQMRMDKSTLSDNLRGDAKMSLKTAMKLLKALKFTGHSPELEILKELNKQFKK